MTVAQSIQSTWFWNQGIRPYTETPLRTKIDPATVSSAGSAVWNNWWFGSTSSVGAIFTPFSSVQFYSQQILTTA